MMRLTRALLTLPVAAGLLLAATPAAASAPVVTPPSCDEQGGTYAQDRDTRSCTTQSTETQTAIVLLTNQPVTVGTGSTMSGIQGIYGVSRTSITRTTVTSSRGTTTSASTVSYAYDVIKLRCVRVPGFSSLPISTCEQADAYPSEISETLIRFIDSDPARFGWV